MVSKHVNLPQPHQSSSQFDQILLKNSSKKLSVISMKLNETWRFTGLVWPCLASRPWYAHPGANVGSASHAPAQGAAICCHHPLGSLRSSGVPSLLTISNLLTDLSILSTKVLAPLRFSDEIVGFPIWFATIHSKKTSAVMAFQVEPSDTPQKWSQSIEQHSWM